MKPKKRQRSRRKRDDRNATVGDELFPRTSNRWSSADALADYRILFEPNVAAGSFVVFRLEQGADGSEESTQG